LDRDYETFLEKKYHTEINKLERKSDKKRMFEIFTITDNDIPLERWKQFLDKNVLGFNFKERLMFLMLETEDEPNGVILCKICMQTTAKLLKVTPDFNSLTQAYTLKHININCNYLLLIISSTLIRNNTFISFQIFSSRKL
jgi:hypothetical protein